MWKKINEKIVYKGWRQIKLKKFELPDGQLAEFDILSSNSFVTVAAFTPQEEVILIRQYRPGPERELLSFCEGAIDPGEQAVEAAHRELLEETGFQTTEMIFLKKKYSAYTDQTQFFFLALNCREIQLPQLDASEFISLEIISKEQFSKILRDREHDVFSNIDAAYLAFDYFNLKKPNSNGF